jgi:MoxR-like ATPase
MDCTAFSAKIEELKAQIAQIIVGQQQGVDLILTSLLANGHVLIEGVPGVAKTLMAKLTAKLIDAAYSRIQFTPDLMPSDVLGTSVFNLKINDFEFKKGPIFSEVVLIDEINRAPAKTQAALFEVMEERQITIDGTSRKMSDLYIVIATQNPIEQEGTYRLPEAQLDRFLMKITISYPSPDEELTILKRHHENSGLTCLDEVRPILTKDDILQFKQLINRIIVDNSLLQYISDIIIATRNSAAIYLGASPRASVALLNSSKAYALLQGRDFVIPDDIKYLAVPVLQHRITLSPETEMEGKSAATVVRRLADNIAVPK